MGVYDFVQMVLDWRYKNLRHRSSKLLLIKIYESEIFNKMTSLKHIFKLIRFIVILQKDSLKNFLIIHRRLLLFIFLKFAVLYFNHQIFR